MELAAAKAVVSGGASGLGFATAKRVIDAGGQVALLDVNDEQGHKSTAELGDRATYIHTDVSNEAEVQDAIMKANEFMGGITLAVNCAGVVGAARALGREAPMATEFFARTVAINLVGSFTVAKEAANVMQNNEPNDDGERGLIVSTASVAAFEGQIGQVSYSASKGGVVGMTLPLAREFARIGIRVNVIAPGLVYTPMVAPRMNDDLRQYRTDAAPLKTEGTGWDVGYAALFLASDEARWITGICLPVDAGLTSVHPGTFTPMSQQTRY